MNTPTPQSADGLLNQQIALDFQSALANAKGDPVAIDKAMRDFMVSLQRAAVTDKGAAALVKIFEEKPKLLLQLANQTQELSKNAADRTIGLDEQVHRGLNELLIETEKARRGLRMSPQEGEAGIYRFAGVLKAICHLVGYPDGANYLDQKIVEWKRNLKVDLETTDIERRINNQTLNPNAAIGVVDRGTARAVGNLNTVGGSLVHQALNDLIPDLNRVPMAGPLTGVTLNGSERPATAPAAGANGASAVVPDVGSVLQRIGKEAKIDQAKIDALVEAGVKAAGSDNRAGLSKEDMALLKISKPFKDLPEQQRAAVVKGLELVMK